MNSSSPQVQNVQSARLQAPAHAWSDLHQPTALAGPCSHALMSGPECRARYREVAGEARLQFGRLAQRFFQDTPFEVVQYAWIQMIVQWFAPRALRAVEPQTQELNKTERFGQRLDIDRRQISALHQPG